MTWMACGAVISHRSTRRIWPGKFCWRAVGRSQCGQALDAESEVRRLGDVVRALRVGGRLEEHDRWSRAQVEALQRARLAEIVEFAVARSPLYRELYASIDAPISVPLQQLPIVDRDQLMGNFDRWVTDRALTLEGIERHLSALTSDDAYHLGRPDPEEHRLDPAQAVVLAVEDSDDGDDEERRDDEGHG